RLSSGLISRVPHSRRLPGVDRGVTLPANDESFPPSGGHHLDPVGFLPSSRFLEILQGADMMDINVLIRSAKLAFLRSQSLEEFAAIGDRGLHSLLVLNGRVQVAFEGESAESCDPRWFALAFSVDGH